MRAFVRYVTCPSCGRVHQFCLPPVDPVAQHYGFVCPETGGSATLAPWGPWDVCDARPTGAIELLPVHSDWVSIPHGRPIVDLDA